MAVIFKFRPRILFIISINFQKNPIISRVSGVKFNDEQNLNSMEKMWGGLVDQVAFVNYNPWENSYQKDIT